MIWGENGSGKTAVLEAIHILSFGRSFRTHKQRDLIRNSDDALAIRGGFLTNRISDDVAAQVIRSSGQKIKLNGKILFKIEKINVDMKALENEKNELQKRIDEFITLQSKEAKEMFKSFVKLNT